MDDLFVVANHVEAGLWVVIAAWFAAVLLLGRTRRRVDCLLAATAFAAFGLSDVVEARTGAWWQPWWLLVWKGACLAASAVLLVRHARARRGKAR